jgi:hypothetical protein
MFRHTIRGMFTDIPWWRGRDGMRTRAFGLADPISHSEWVLELDGGAGLDGDGAIGDSTGTTITLCLTTGGTIPGAERFITGAPTLAVDLHMAGVSRVGVGRGPSTETGERLAGMRRLTARVECVRAPSAATTMADRPGVSLHGEARVSGAAGSTVAAEGTAAADDGNLWLTRWAGSAGDPNATPEKRLRSG